MLLSCWTLSNNNSYIWLDELEQYTHFFHKCRDLFLLGGGSVGGLYHGQGLGDRQKVIGGVGKDIMCRVTRSIKGHWTQNRWLCIQSYLIFTVKYFFIIRLKPAENIPLWLFFLMDDPPAAKTFLHFNGNILKQSVIMVMFCLLFMILLWSLWVFTHVIHFKVYKVSSGHFLIWIHSTWCLNMN